MRLFIVLFISFGIISPVRAKNYEPFVVGELGKTIYEGVFTGNGLLGTMTYLQSQHTALVSIGRTDVYDHREDDISHLFSRARLPIGHFELQLERATIQQTSGLISIQNADATASIMTDEGEILIKTLTFSEENYMLIEIDRSKFSGKYNVNFVPAKSQSPRTEASWVKQPDNYQPNPDPLIGESHGVRYVDQTLLAGGGYATAYTMISERGRDIIIATIAYARKGNDYTSQAITEIKSFRKTDIGRMVKTHRNWWSNYMQQSTYHIPDSSLQRFYDMQMYKFACLTRADKPAVDLQGPWTGAFTPWPAYWFNLNIQLTYSPMYTANRLDEASSLIKMLDTHKDNLALNIHADYRYDSYGLSRSGSSDMLGAPIKLHRDNTEQLDEGNAELSNLTWTLLYYYQHYRYSMDEKLKAPLYNLLKRSVNLALHFLDKNQEGKYSFVVPTHSPEYYKLIDFNTNYDLATLRWGLQTLLELAETEETDQAYLRKLQDVQANLIDYPQHENGYKISENQSYEQSHRHYSHLMMIYPYYLVDIEDTAVRALVLRSIEHWQSKKAYLQGYSLSGAASMYAMLGNGDKAVQSLIDLNKKFIQPNTLYKESGPVIETPFSMAASLQELSLQHWQGLVRVFPAIPEEWKDVSFHNFRTDGAFLISAEKIDGITKKVEVTSEHSGDINLWVDQPMNHIVIEGKGKIIKTDGKRYEVYLEQKSKAILTN